MLHMWTHVSSSLLHLLHLKAKRSCCPAKSFAISHLPFLPSIPVPPKLRVHVHRTDMARSGCPFPGIFLMYMWTCDFFQCQILPVRIRRMARKRARELASQSAAQLPKQRWSLGEPRARFKASSCVEHGASHTNRCVSGNKNTTNGNFHQ